jgi:preprotein translocase subunit YajC
MMSLPEQGAKVATSVVDAMKSQPMMLAVIVLNAIIITLIYFAITSNRQSQHEIMGKLIEQMADCNRKAN